MRSLLESHAAVALDIATGNIAALVGRYPPAQAIAERAGLPIWANREPSMVAGGIAAPMGCSPVPVDVM